MKKNLLLALAILTVGFASAQAETGFSESFGTYYYTPKHCYSRPQVAAAPCATVGFASTHVETGCSESVGRYYNTPKHRYNRRQAAVAPCVIGTPIAENPCVVTPHVRDYYNVSTYNVPTYNAPTCDSTFERQPRDANYEIRGQNNRSVFSDPFRGSWTYGSR